MLMRVTIGNHFESIRQSFFVIMRPNIPSIQFTVFIEIPQYADCPRPTLTEYQRPKNQEVVPKEEFVERGNLIESLYFEMETLVSIIILGYKLHRCCSQRFTDRDGRRSIKRKVLGKHKQKASKNRGTDHLKQHWPLKRRLATVETPSADASAGRPQSQNSCFIPFTTCQGQHLSVQRVVLYRVVS
jgi:hypothetical protein